MRFGNGIDKAASEVKRFREARATLELRTRTAEQELEALRNSLPDWQLESVLGSIESSEKVQDARRRIPALEAELASTPQLEKKLIASLRDAIRGLNHAKAVVILSDVEKLRKELDLHQGKTATLLEQLAKHEGDVQFVPHRGIATMAPGLQGSDIPFFITKSEAMQNKINGLLREAEQIESRPIGGGAANASSLDELLQAVAADTEGIPPSASAIRAWHESALVEAELDWKRTSSDFAGSETLPREVQISLSWNADAEIMPGSSVRIKIAPVSREVAMQTFGAEYVRQVRED